MCGIAGFIDQKGTLPASRLGKIATAMADAIAHRGPDEGNAWVDENARLAFGHRRLSIVDLSSAGRQPMVSTGGRYVICYNGEIYNAADLRLELGSKSPNFRGHSDTEVLLEACAIWGVEATVKKTIGMFAFALWDREDGRLWLVRDRVGIKPLYWSLNGGQFVFGSELRALRAFPEFSPALDRDALVAYLRHGYYPYPNTVFDDVHQLPPGHILTFAPGSEPQMKAYWSLADVFSDARQETFQGDEAEAIDGLESLLVDAIKSRMIADVPLGAFLSGGYDSSTVVALMQACSSRPVSTFSIGFNEDGYNEAVNAKAVAEHLGTAHTELYITPQEARDVIGSLPEMYDEPFADSSQIPTYLVSKLARGNVTVALSGDGGDELFAGYNRYTQADHINQWVSRVPSCLRRMAAGSIRAVPPGAWDTLAAAVPDRWRPARTGDKAHKLASVIGASGDRIYHRLTSLWQDPSDVVTDGSEPYSVITDPEVQSIAPEYVSRMQYRDTLHYLPNDILTKVDRASMAVSLEARVPLLDHRVVDYASRLPLHFKIRDGERKWILRQVLYRHVPRKLVDRPKMGFGVPIDSWLRGPLRDWAEDLLDAGSLAAGGYFQASRIRQKWSEHLSGRRNWQHALWTVLMFEAWRRRWGH